MPEFLRRIRRWSKRSSLLAVSDDDLEEWLTSLGVLESIRCGKKRCFMCDGSIDVDHVQLVSRVQGEIVLVCDRPECVYRFTQPTVGFRQ